MGRFQAMQLFARIAELAGHRDIAYLSATSGQLQPLELSAGGRIERIEPLADYRPPALPMSVLSPHHRHLPPRLRVLIDWLVELFGA